MAMYEEQFSKRLTELRTQKGVSARDMSLNRAESRLYSCNRKWYCLSDDGKFLLHLRIFQHYSTRIFNFGEETSNGMNALVDQLKQFDAEQINALTAFIKTIVKSKLSKNLILGKPTER